VPTDKNLLAAEQSPYLRQHAKNPVAWQPWGDAALDQARQLDRPIFLSIGYSTCHWCHVMAHESFEDPSVAALLNRDFVSIKVDREERPDLDAVYMTVCQIMTGQGGWPLTVILTPECAPFFATTYVPRESGRGRIGMLELLPRIVEVWESRRLDVDRSAAEITEALRRATRVPEGSAPGVPDLDAATHSLATGFDPMYGGFSAAPKFPSPHTLMYLLRTWDRTGNRDLLDKVVATLDAMQRGGIHDQLAGGFHRYSTDVQWKLPHFEKMLYDQAMLSLAYTEAWTATGEGRFASIVRSTLDYLLNELVDEAGGFHSAEDADSEGEEGKFYVWTESEIAAVLANDSDLRLAIDAFGIQPEGNFHDESTGRLSGSNVLLVAERPADLAVGHGGSAEAVSARLAAIKKQLLMARCARVRPERDDKVLTDWNGLAIAALARAGAVLKEPRYVQAASQCAEFISSHLRTANGRLLHRWRAGSAAIPAMADDFASLAWGFVELYGATFNPEWLDRATEVLDVLLEEFESQGGGLFQTGVDEPATLIRILETADGAMPSANSVAASVLLQIAQLTGRSDYDAAVSRLLEGTGGRVRAAPAAHTALLQVVDRLIGDSLQIVVVGERQDPTVQQMLDLIGARFLPRVAVLLKPIGDEDACLKLARIAPFTESMTAAAGAGTAYICRGHACDRPIIGPEALVKVLDGVTARRVTV